MQDVTFYKDDDGKKVYKVRTVYTLVTEEIVKCASDEGENPFDIWLDQGGIDHDKINQYIMHEGKHCEPIYAEVMTGMNENTVKYLGTVQPDIDPETDEVYDYWLDESIDEKEKTSLKASEYYKQKQKETA